MTSAQEKEIQVTSFWGKVIIGAILVPSVLGFVWVGQLENRVANNEEDIDNLETEVQSVEEDIDQINRNLNSILLGIEQIKGRLGIIENE